MRRSVGWILAVTVAVGAVSAPARKLPEHLKKLPPKERIRELRKEIAAHRADAWTLFFLANAFYEAEELDSALTYYRSALFMDSTFAKARVNLALVYDARGQKALAERELRTALRHRPDDPLALCHLGYLYYSRGEYDRGVDLYRRALKIDPDNAQAHYNLGYAFAEAHLYPEALREWERTAELDPRGRLGRTAKENARLLRKYLEMPAP